MEWWQSGLSALVGVIVGGLFTYLGLRKQLEQQKEIDARSWRRKVRSEPLLALRDELAHAAVIEGEFTGAAYAQPLLKDVRTDQELQKRLEDAIRDRDNYSRNGKLKHVLHIQADRELIEKVEEIIKAYQHSCFTAEHYVRFREKDREKGIAVFEENKTKIIEAQELINKKLEEL